MFGFVGSQFEPKSLQTLCEPVEKAHEHQYNCFVALIACYVQSLHCKDEQRQDERQVDCTFCKGGHKGLQKICLLILDLICAEVGFAICEGVVGYALEGTGLQIY